MRDQYLYSIMCRSTSVRVWHIQIMVQCLTRKDLEVSSKTSLVTYKMSSTRRAQARAGSWVTPQI